jgi:hypothetical protein
MSELQIIKPITVAEAELLDIKASYENLVVTKETLKQVDAARKFLKTKRLDIQKTVEANKKAVRDLLKQHEDEGERLIGIIKPVEDRLAKEQKELEEKEAAELRAKLKAEEDRKRAIKARIAGIESMTSNVRKGVYDEKIADIVLPDKGTFEEYNEEGDAAVEMLYGAIENRKLFIKEQADIEARKRAAELAAQPQVIEQPAPTLRQQKLIDLGFTDSGFAWIHANGTKIPYAMMDVADDVFEALLKPFNQPQKDLFTAVPTAKPSDDELRRQYVKPNPNLGENTSTTQQFKPDFDAIVKQTTTPEVKTSETPDLNYFETNGFTIGIDKRIPFSKVMAVKKAIIETIK